MASGNSLTPEALASLLVPTNVRISPSGLQVVYQLTPSARSGVQDKSGLWIADVGREHSSRPLTSGSSNDTSPEWSPDGGSIAFVSDRKIDNGGGELSSIFLLPLHGGDPYPIVAVPEANCIKPTIKWSPDGGFIAFLGPDPKSTQQQGPLSCGHDINIYGERWPYNRLRLVHVSTRRGFPLVSGNFHVTDFAWDSQSSEIAYIAQQTPEIDSSGHRGVSFLKVSLSSRVSTKICQFPGPACHLTWLSDAHLHFLAGTVPTTVATSSVIYQVSLHEKTCSKSIQSFGINSCATGPLRTAGKSLVVQAQKGLSDVLCLIRGEQPSTIYQAEQSISTWDVLIDDSTSNSVVVVGQSSASRPTEIYSVHVAQPCQLSQHGAPIATLLSAYSRPLYCKADDGTPIDGVLYTPSTTKEFPKSLSTIVLVHGGPYERVSNSFMGAAYSNWTPWLVSAGYAILCPNYRGSSSHGEAFAAATRGAMGTKDYDDIVSLVKAGIAEGVIDDRRVGIGGWSQGGFLSYLAATRPNSFHFRAAVCGAGVTDWDTVCMTSAATWFGSELLGSAPWKEDDINSTAARQASPFWHVKDIRNTPILILHGEQDARIPVSQATSFHRSCLHHNKPCQIVVYRGEGHFIQEGQHYIDMLKRIRHFYDTHLRS